jgi:hypothetical protein
MKYQNHCVLAIGAIELEIGVQEGRVVPHVSVDRVQDALRGPASEGPESGDGHGMAAYVRSVLRFSKARLATTILELVGAGERRGTSIAIEKGVT